MPLIQFTVCEVRAMLDKAIPIHEKHHAEASKNHHEDVMAWKKHNKRMRNEEKKGAERGIQKRKELIDTCANLDWDNQNTWRKAHPFRAMLKDEYSLQYFIDRAESEILFMPSTKAFYYNFRVDKPTLCWENDGLTFCNNLLTKLEKYDDDRKIMLNLIELEYLTIETSK